MNHAFEFNAAPRSSYQEQIDNIVSRSLTPENVTSYAEDAQKDLLAITVDMIESYHQRPEDYIQKEGRLEEQAFWYHDLNPSSMQHLLDHFAAMTNRSGTIDQVITKAQQDDYVYVHPDHERPPIVTYGNTKFAEKGMIDRLKTTLLVLENSFAVNSEDKSELSIKKGIITDTMMRRNSYYAVEIPKINRTILLCDEEGNVSFIFDAANLLTHEIDTEQLLLRTKDELRLIIASDHNVGRQLKYSKYFARNMYDAILDPRTQPGKESDDTTPLRYLDPETLASLHSDADVAAQLGMSRGTLRKKAKANFERLGKPLRVVKGRGLPSVMWTTEQVAAMPDIFDREDMPKLDSEYDEGAVLLKSVHQILNARRETIKTDIEAAELGSIEKRWFGNYHGESLSSSQFEKLKQYRATLVAPETLLVEKAFAAEFNADKGSVSRAIHKLGAEALGERKEYRVRGVMRPHLDPWQQNMIYDVLQTQGEFLPVAPDDFKSRGGFYDTWGIRAEIFDKAIASISDELGEAPRMKFGSKRVPGYSPHQQQLILAAVPLVRKFSHDE